MKRALVMKIAMKKPRIVMKAATKKAPVVNSNKSTSGAARGGKVVNNKRIMPMKKKAGTSSTGNRTVMRKKSAAVNDPVTTQDRDNLSSGITSKKTKPTYHAGVSLYRDMCPANKIKKPFPLTLAKVETYAAYLKREKYLSPWTYISAILRYHKDHHKTVPIEDPNNRLKDLSTAVERDLPPQEQMWPINLEMLRKLFADCRNDLDLDVALVLTAAFFSCARIGSILELDLEGDVVFTEGDAMVKVDLPPPKGEIRDNKHHLEFERLLDMERPFKSFIGDIQCCPVCIFKMLQRRKSTGSFRDYNQYERSLSFSVDRAGILPSEAGDSSEKRKRKYISTHSGRIGGTCCLLKAGLSQRTISVIGHWADDSKMLIRYAKFVIQRPSAVQGLAFYNPRSFKNQYNNSKSTA